MVARYFASSSFALGPWGRRSRFAAAAYTLSRQWVVRPCPFESRDRPFLGWNPCTIPSRQGLGDQRVFQTYGGSFGVGNIICFEWGPRTPTTSQCCGERQSAARLSALGPPLRSHGASWISSLWSPQCDACLQLERQSYDETGTKRDLCLLATNRACFGCWSSWSSLWMGISAAHSRSSKKTFSARQQRGLESCLWPHAEECACTKEVCLEASSKGFASLCLLDSFFVPWQHS